MPNSRQMTPAPFSVVSFGTHMHWTTFLLLAAFSAHVLLDAEVAAEVGAATPPVP